MGRLEERSVQALNPVGDMVNHDIVRREVIVFHASVSPVRRYQPKTLLRWRGLEENNRKCECTCIGRDLCL
jgi:hypothetical protein